MKGYFFIFLTIFPIFLLVSCSPKKPSTVIDSTQFTNSVTRGQYLYITLKNEQSIDKLSQDYEVPIKIIKDLNILKDKSLKPGAIIKLPIIKYHFIKYTDSLKSIAKMYHIELGSLTKHNNISLNSTIHAGKYIKIPDSNNDFVNSNGLRHNYCSSHSENNTVNVNKSQNKSYHIVTKSNDSVSFNNKHPANLKNFEWPVNGRVIKKYGNINGQFNEGINIITKKGSLVKAASYGQVVYNGYQNKYGNLIIIKHDGGYMTAYSHLEKSLIQKGQIVRKGAHIGTVGSSGNVTQPQLQFAMKKGTNTINPDK